MLQAHGHELFIYGPEECDAVCVEHVVIVRKEEQHAWWPGWDPRTDYWPDGWNTGAPWWQVTNARAIAEIEQRIQPGDAVATMAGVCQEPVLRHFADYQGWKYLLLEPGIGYKGIIDDAYHAFESSAWMHWVYGMKGWDTGRFYDTVIPNAFFVDELPYEPEPDDYLLYLGRMIPNKGMAVIEEIAKRHRVITAGQGDERIAHAEHVGVVTGDAKTKLLSRARGVLVPTFYLEPFGGVAVEAMMCGVPVITTDFGAFRETVRPNGGFRCSTLAEFMRAAERIDDLQRPLVRAEAVGRYGTTAVARLYDRWLRRLDTLHYDGWYHQG